MPNNPEMSRFLYTIVKQLDLKSIDWNQVSAELGITNGHAARMRYSRFKQQMEGNTPIRRTRNPNAKRAPKQKRAKGEGKDLQKVKMEGSPSMGECMTGSSPSVATMDASQGSLTPAMSESVPAVKSEPGEDPVSPETPLAMATANYTSPSMAMQTMSLPDQAHQPGPVLTAQPPSCEGGVPEFTFDPNHPHIQQQHHQERMYQHMMPQMHMAMGLQNMTEDMLVPEQQEFGINYYNHQINDVVNLHSSHGMMPMVKVEEHWGSSYGQS